MSEPLPICTRQLRKVYHPRTRRELVALNGLDLEIQPGHVFGFIGPNGAGKSTTIKILVGLTWQSAGEATIFGHPVGSAAARRMTGYLPEIANYHDFMGVMELLDIHAQLAGVPSSERRKKCQDALEQVDLAHRSSSRIRELSKGMQQRFGIAQAIVASPPLLILDEVTSGLDPLGQKEVKDIILRLKGRGITIFFSSHKLTEVENICDTLGIVHRGKMLACTTLDSFLQADASIEVQFNGGDARAALEKDGMEPKAADPGARLTVPRDRVDAVLDRIREASGSVLCVQPQRKTLEDAFFELITAEERK